MVILNYLDKYKKAIICTLSVFAFAIASILLIVDLPHINNNYGDYFEFTLIITLVCIMIASVSCFIIFFTRLKIEHIFLICFILLGIVYNLVITPFAVPDESTHWQKVNRIVDKVMSDIDNKDMYDSSNRYIKGVRSHNNSREVYKTITDTLFIPDSSVGEFITYNVGRNAYPVQYAPAALGLAIGEIVPASKIMQFYTGRLFNLAFAAILMFISIKIIPKYKLSLFVIALLPMVIHQSASYSYDAFLNSMAILLVALLICEICTEKTTQLKLSRYVLITAIAVLLAPIKYVYCLFILLVFFIPQDRFRSKTDYYFKTLLSVGLTFFAAILFFLSTMTTWGMDTGEPQWHGYVTYTNSFILNNPVQTIRIFVDTTIHNMGYFIRTCFGEILCGLTMYVNSTLITGFILLFIVTLFSKESNGIIINYKLRLLLLFIIVSMYIGILYSMFIAWTPNYFTTIAGVQGRYFIPLLLPIVIILKNRLFILPDTVERYMLIMPVFLNILVIYDVMTKTIMI